MAGSRWNQWHDLVLAENLTVAEHRLALAFGRLLLGWCEDHGLIGQRLLRETSRLDGRSFERALTGLVDKGLVRVVSHGHRRRADYALNLNDQLPAPERADVRIELPAPERAEHRKPSARSGGTKLPALQRGRIDRKVKPSEQSSAMTTEPNELRRQAFDAYQSTGGNLKYDRERGALARAVTAALNAGTEEPLILTACRDLGRTRDFPGLLKKRIKEIADAGGPCANQGSDRSRLTAAQLAECGCPTCLQWAVALREPEAVGA